MNPSRGAAPGFTLVEMLVVVGILSVLAMMVMPMAELAATRQKERELRHALWQIREAIDAYKRAVDQGRIARTTASGYPASLAVLAEGAVQQAGGSRIYFLRQIPRDPFAAQQLAAEQTWGLRAYASAADRPEPGDDVFDVHSRSGRTGLNGIALSRW